MMIRRLAIVVALVLIATSAYSGEKLGTQKISLELEGVPIVSVLDMIASQNDLNLVVSGVVTGEVTMRLENVEIGAALDAILTANGYNYFIQDDIIIVKSVEVAAFGELETQIITLKYLSPATAVKAITSRQSAIGSVIILDKTGKGQSEPDDNYHPNRIMISDRPDVMEGLLAIVSELDIPERSVLIEARIIETTLDSKSNLGLAWPTALSATFGGAGLNTGTTTIGTTLDQSGGSAGVYDPNNGRWNWGKLSVGEVNLILNMLEQNGNSKLISDPRITTLENYEAEFKFETIIPIQTVSRFTEGAATSDIVTFEDKSVGIILRVIPRINGDGQITLEVFPTVEDIIRYVGPLDSQRPVTASRSIRTKVTVGDGETVALGGLLKEDQIESIQRVPILGHIPILGPLLFTNKSTETTSTDLIILITPHILD